MMSEGGEWRGRNLEVGRRERLLLLLGWTARLVDVEDGLVDSPHGPVWQWQGCDWLEGELERGSTGR